MILPYIKSTQVFTCPSFSNSVGANGSQGKFVPQAQLTVSSNNQFGSYAINSAYYNEPNIASPAGRTGTALSDVADSSGTVWVSDANGYFEIAWQTIAGQPTITTLSNGSRGLSEINERHLSTSNLLYVDGHVKSLGLDSVTRTSATSAGAYSVLTCNKD